jgi:hypothetical protein
MRQIETAPWAGAMLLALRFGRDRGKSPQLARGGY